MSRASERRFMRMQERAAHEAEVQRHDRAVLRQTSTNTRRSLTRSDSSATRTEVRRWMRANATEYDGPTQLAEAANAQFELPGQGLDDESHWVWDDAASFYD